MPPFRTTTAATTGDPAIGLVPSLVVAVLGLAIVVVIVVKLAGESDDASDDRPAPSPDDGDETTDEPAAADPEAEHTDADVV